MKTQNYSNHGKSYPAHHFVFYPVVIILLIFAVRQALASGRDSDLWWIMSAGIFLTGWGARQHAGLSQMTDVNYHWKITIYANYQQITQVSFF